MRMTCLFIPCCSSSAAGKPFRNLPRKLAVIHNPGGSKATTSSDTINATNLLWQFFAPYSLPE